MKDERRKKSELIDELGKLRRQVSRLKRAHTRRQEVVDETGRQIRITDATNRVLEKSITTESEEEMARTCLEEAEELTGSAFGFLCEVNPRGRLDTLAISDTGWEACRIPGSRELLMANDLETRGIRGLVVEQGRPTIFNDPSSHPAWIEPPGGHPRLTSFMGVPLMLKGKTVGIMGLANKKSGYKPEDQEALEALSVAFVQGLMHKRAQESLQESEDRYRTLVFNVPGAVYRSACDPEKWTMEFFSDAIEDILGYPASDFVGDKVRTYASVIHPDDASMVEEIVLDRVDQRVPFELEYRVICADGGTRWVSDKGQGVFDRDGQLQWLDGVVHDITDRKQAELTIRHLNAVLHAIRNVNQLITIEKDREKLLQGACDNLVDTRGYNSAWIALRDDSGHLVPTAQAGLDEKFLPVRERLASFDIAECCRRAESESGVVVIEDPPSACGNCPVVQLCQEKGAMAIRLEYGGKVYGTMTVSTPARFVREAEEPSLFGEVADDIAFALHNIEMEEEKKRIEEVLREREERYRTLVETMRDGLAMQDMCGLITYANDSFCTMMGYSQDELVGHPWIELMDGQPLEMFKERLADPDKAEENSFEITFVKKDGGKLHTSVSRSSILDAEGNRTGSFGIVTDITDRKRAEKKLRRTMAELERSNRELEQFAYVASHDLQEPLRMVASYTQLLERRYKDVLDDDAREFIGYAVDGANRMQQLINDLLTYSRLSTRGKPMVPTDSHAALGRAIANLQAAIAESGAVVTNDDLPTVRADETQLVQLFQNLVGNAIKFRGEEPPRIHVSAEKKVWKWAFTVRDNGIGIDPEYRDRIFVIFQRLHAKADYTGTGIGLAICHRIVTRHGGRIWVESEPGKGSTFHFTIRG